MPFRASLSSSVLCAFLGISSFTLSVQAEEETKNTPPTQSEQKQTAEQIKFKKPPGVYIAGQRVTKTKDERKIITADKLERLPPSLRSDRARTALENRLDMQVYKHSPIQGEKNAPVTIIEFLDLSCTECFEKMASIEEMREKYSDKIRYVHVHLPSDMYNTTNPAAFYGRLAQEAGKFWDYRKKLMHLNNTSDNVYINTLMDLGISGKSLRKMVRRKASQFYKQLDADFMLSKKIGEIRPPAVYVNGIKIGSIITENQMEDLIQYEIEVNSKQHN